MGDCKIVFSVDPVQAFSGINKSLKNKALRNAVSKGSGVVRDHMTTIAPSLTGSLKKSLKIRLKSYQGKAVWAGIIGPKSSYVRNKGKYKRGPKKGEVKRIRPSKYAHLVERGHGGPHPAPAHPFVAPALRQSKSAYQRTLVQKLQETIRDGLRKK